MRILKFAALIALFAACNHSPVQVTPRAAAAQVLTERYAKSRFAPWDVHAAAAGKNCDVLLVTTAIVLQDSMVEALHYGSGPYDVVDGGIQKFYRNREFRGVAYKDLTGRVWNYGALDDREAELLVPCD